MGFYVNLTPTDPQSAGQACEALERLLKAARAFEAELRGIEKEFGKTEIHLTDADMQPVIECLETAVQEADETCRAIDDAIECGTPLSEVA